MARLRNNEKFGKSIKCATMAPYAKGEGPTFTVHIFDTGSKEDGLQVCAYELWQRDDDGKRTALVYGDDFLSADPTSSAAMHVLVEKLATAPESIPEDATIQAFYREHAKYVAEDARERFAPRSPKRTRSVAQETATAPAQQASRSAVSEASNAPA